MENFFNQILEDGYELLTLKKVPWPYELDDSKKVELLEKLLDYYSKKEDFDKCIILQKNIMMLSSTKKRRPRTKRKSN
jgi:hypothetical protein